MSEQNEEKLIRKITLRNRLFVLLIIVDILLAAFLAFEIIYALR